ncbi:MAG: UMP kinase [Candidatus Levybacteria bacterium]|nr:UMP kinase [Candidatus Levybacteria bacterium]MBP9815179.1 UMP kinase [Candidatus Levybacteria bacterium]
MGNGKEKIVLSVGGSLLVPDGGVSIDFLKQLNNFIRLELANDPNRQFFLVVGGGTIARKYRDAGRDVVGHELTADDLDWLGIHATKLNAHLVRTVFRDIAHPFVLKHYEIIRKVEEPVIVAAGWKPGWSTDFCATMICEDYNVKTILNLTNIPQVYTADPRKDPTATPIKDITWTDFRKLVGDKWDPGMNMPFDPIASKKAQELGLKVIIIKGENFENIKNALEGREFFGTTIEGE